MVYNESSPTEFASVYDTGRTSADPAGTMETPALAKAGTATYSDFAFRWGDYSGIAVDPDRRHVLERRRVFHRRCSPAIPANWATWISHFTIAPTVISSDPGGRLGRHRHAADHLLA